MSSSKIALITGGSRGLGKNMAIRLAEKGFDVIITYQSRKEAADEVVKEIESVKITFFVLLRTILHAMMSLKQIFL